MRARPSILRRILLAVALTWAGLMACTACHERIPVGVLPQPKAEAPHLVMHADRVFRANAGPVVFTALLRGNLGPAFRCVNEEWEWGDGTRSGRESAANSACDEAEPGRAFRHEHAYGPGKYSPQLHLTSRGGKRRLADSEPCGIQVGPEGH